MMLCYLNDSYLLYKGYRDGKTEPKYFLFIGSRDSIYLLDTHILQITFILSEELIGLITLLKFNQNIILTIRNIKRLLQ